MTWIEQLSYGTTSLQLAEDRLERVLQGQGLAEHLRDGEQRLGAQAGRFQLSNAVCSLLGAGVRDRPASLSPHHARSILTPRGRVQHGRAWSAAGGGARRMADTAPLGSRVSPRTGRHMKRFGGQS